MLRPPMLFLGAFHSQCRRIDLFEFCATLPTRVLILRDYWDGISPQRLVFAMIEYISEDKCLRNMQSDLVGDILN
jgi:hypothetical protein